MKEIAAAYLAADRWLERNHNLTVPGYLIIEEALRRLNAGEQPMTMGEMCETLGWACSTATDGVDRLERKGWIRRQRSERDRRVIHLVLTNPTQAAEVKRQFEGHMPKMGGAAGDYLEAIVRFLSRDAIKSQAG